MLSAADLYIDIAIYLGMHPTYVQNIIKTAPLRYKVFTIPKRRSGLREVAQPAREVKEIQKWIVSQLQPRLPLHKAATAYRIGGSIKQNAEPHVVNSYLLKLDFENFFPSIKFEDIVNHLNKYCADRYDNSAQRLMAYVCCWAKNRQPPLRLCIGAPSSPFISNTILFDFDTAMSKIANECSLTYTRYADDITLSSSQRNALALAYAEVGKLILKLEYPKIKLNKRKTVFASKAGRRVVTGVSLSNDSKLTIGRERKRTIRAMYHRKKHHRLSEDEEQKLAGLIAFAKSIEPGFEEWLKGSHNF